MTEIDRREELPLWLKLPKETTKGYVAFQHYRDSPAGERSLRQTQRELKYRSLCTIQGWSSKFQWQKRISAFDIEQDRIAIEAKHESIRQMNTRQAEDSTGFQKGLTLPVRVLAEKLKSKEKAQELIDELSELEITRLFKLVLSAAQVYPSISGVERIARGQPSEISQTNIDGSSGAPISAIIFNDVTANEFQTKLLDRLYELQSGKTGTREIAEATVIDDGVQSDSQPDNSGNDSD